MSSTFRSAVVRIPAGPDSIEIIDVPVAEPGPGQVRVDIAAATVNPVDLALTAGVFHSLGLITRSAYTGIGTDFAGTVSETGPGVEIPVGSRVAGLLSGFDRDFGTYAEQVIVAASDIARVPDELDPSIAATVPLNSLTAAQLVDLLGAGDGRGLLVTGAAGAVGSYVIRFAQERGWRVTGLARAGDEEFVRGLGADFTVAASPYWDAVADAATLQEEGLALVRDGGLFIGVRPGAEPPAERGITVRAVAVQADGARLAGFLADTANGRLPARVHAVLPLDRAADAHRELARGGIRGKYVLRP
ncbi:NADP-dependent oxidoreductase [Nocardia sp. NBC_01329]|uniref:NADP-dependent oxidoreductase n=1 Tax=Nocardia sp. NBC_01329 TaxID=2903594 RepID=UPI002E129337|nr:NADP-dependent oxidoreductase [Nocardia sp. NBC_01329]